MTKALLKEKKLQAVEVAYQKGEISEVLFNELRRKIVVNPCLSILKEKVVFNKKFYRATFFIFINKNFELDTSEIFNSNSNKQYNDILVNLQTL